MSFMLNHWHSAMVSEYVICLTKYSFLPSEQTCNVIDNLTSMKKYFTYCYEREF